MTLFLRHSDTKFIMLFYYADVAQDQSLTYPGTVQTHYLKAHFNKLVIIIFIFLYE